MVALILTWTKGARIDYSHYYLFIWDVTMAGGDPWQETQGGGNAYGPAFNLFAPLATWHPLLPKYIFVLSWIGLACWYIHFVRSSSSGSAGSHVDPEGTNSESRNSPNTSESIITREGWLLAYFFLNPLFWIMIPIYGNFDIVLTCICVAALHLFLTGRSARAGTLLAIGTLFKFYPAVLVPLFTSNRRRENRRFLAAFVIVIGLGLGLAWLLWGNSVFSPILWATDRPSKHLSIFRFLRGSFSPTPDLDWLSGPCTLIAVLVVFWYSVRYRLALPTASFAILLTLFTFYKVGHVQYLLLLFGLFPYLVLMDRLRFRQRRSLSIAATCYLSWISLYLWLYYLGHEMKQPPWSYLREIGGLITFPLAIWLLVTLLRSAREELHPTSNQEYRRVETERVEDRL
jgi:hypothetical protein